MNFKQALRVCLMGVVAFVPMTVHAGTNDDIANACYLTKECGGMAFGRTLVATTAAAMGANAGVILGVPGFVMGGYAGYVVGNKLGGKILAGAANEYIQIGNQCLECDTYQMGEHYECPNGTIVTNGSQVLKCHTGITGDRWKDFTLQACPNSPIKNKQAKNTKAEIKATVTKPVGNGAIVASGDACLYITCIDGKYNASKNECLPTTCPDKYKDGNVPCWGSQTGAKTCYRKCHADFKGATTMIVECEAGYTPAEKNAGWKTADGKPLYAKCVKNSNGGGNGNGNGNGGSNGGGNGNGNGGGNGNGNGGGGSVTVPCRTKRTTAVGKACCDTGSMGEYNKATDTCTCMGRGLQFKMENGRGKCVPINLTPTNDYDCDKDDAEKMSNVRMWKTKCADNTEIMTQITALEEFCRSNGRTKELFTQYYVALLEMSPNNCGATPEVSAEEELCKKVSDASMVGGVCKCNDANKELDREALKCVISASAQQESKVKIESSIKKIESLQTSMGKSVWKNKEGNFNTSRLASDGIAGVVLGTAGGLITSNVVKKNQIKGGFEDINCTIGGQVVSGWGDEFNVGISTR